MLQIVRGNGFLDAGRVTDVVAFDVVSVARTALESSRGLVSCRGLAAIVSDARKKNANAQCFIWSSPGPIELGLLSGRVKLIVGTEVHACLQVVD